MFLRIQPSSLLTRLAGGLGVALVLILSVLAARPDWHELLCRHETKATACAHHHQHGSATEQQHHTDGLAGEAESCVIALFAHGHILAAIFIALLLFLVIAAQEWAATARVLSLAAVDCDWPHGCGPPTA